MRRRSIMCIDQKEMALPDTSCKSETKPLDAEPCDVPTCDANDINEKNNPREININENIIKS